MTSRIPQPKTPPKMAALRWKTRLTVPPIVPLGQGTTTSIYAGENPKHVFFHDETQNSPTKIMGPIWGYGTTAENISSPGPTLEAIAHQTVSINWVNQLPKHAHHPFVEPPRELRSPGMMQRYDVGHTVVHLHGAHVPWTSDGYPMRVSNGMRTHREHKKTVLRPGQHETFDYPNSQLGGATLWYHDHTMDTTAMNVYAGLVGTYLLRHPQEHTWASLPKGPYEIPLVIQDRSFVESQSKTVDRHSSPQMLYGDADFLQSYITNTSVNPPPPFKSYRESFFGGNPDSQPSPEFKGQVICVNGKIWPFLEIEARPYRFRIVNGSNSRVYVMRVSSTFISGDDATDALIAKIPIHQIGADGGLFTAVVQLDGVEIDPPPSDGSSIVSPQHFLALAPGERADVIIDFSGKSGDFYLTNHAEGTAPLGNGGDETIDITDPAKPIPKLTNGILEFRVTLPLVQNANSPLKMDFETLASLDSDLGNFASQPHFPLPSTPTRQYVMEEFGPRCLTIEEAIKESPRGWKAITFQPDIDRPIAPGFLWGGLPPDDEEIGATPNGGPQPHPAEYPPHELGDNVELWEFYNLSPDVHPIHLHHSPVQIHSRVALANPITQTILPSDPKLFGVDDNERGWKDTVRVNPGELTRILVRFDNGGDKNRSAEYYTGHYVWHCHILEHEDMGMMRPLEIIESDKQPLTSYND